MEKETIEQAAERIFPHHKGLTLTASNKIMLRRSAFIKGAKWQEEISIKTKQNGNNTKIIRTN